MITIITPPRDIKTSICIFCTTYTLFKVLLFKLKIEPYHLTGDEIFTIVNVILIELIEVSFDKNTIKE